MGQELGLAHSRRGGITWIGAANTARGASPRRKILATGSADPRRCRAQEVRGNSTGFIRLGQYLAQNDTAIILLWKPYGLHNAVTAARVECEEMSRGLRGIEGQFPVAVRSCPALAKFQQCGT